MKMTDSKSERFSLRWDNFHSNLSTSFHTLLQGEELVDVTIAAEGHFVQAHKLVLSVCSPYFKSLFKVNPCKHPIVILKDVGHRELVDILEFMYRGEVNVSQEDLTEFLKTAELLQVKGLTGDDTPGDSAEQETKTKDTPAEPPPSPQPVKIKTPQKSPARVVASPQPLTSQQAIKTECVKSPEVVQPPPQKRMRQEPRPEPRQETTQEPPQYALPRRPPSVPHASMPQTSTPIRNPVTSTSESSKDMDYPRQEMEYVEMPNPKTEPVEIDSDIEEVDATFDDGSDFSEFFGGQSSQSFQDFSAMGLPDGQSGASQSMGIPVEGEQDLKQKVFSLLESIKNQEQHVKSLVSKLWEKQGAGIVEETNIFLPVNSYEELLALNESVQEEINRKKLIGQLCCLGGNNVADTTRRILNTLIGSDLAVALVWVVKGPNAAVKKSIRDAKNILDIIFCCVQKNPSTSGGFRKDVEDVIKVWLRTAGDRNGGRSKRFVKSELCGGR